MRLNSAAIKELAAACGFELAGIAAAEPAPDFGRFELWRANGMAGEMTYLTDSRGDLRRDPRNLLPSAKSIVCVGKLYNSPPPRSTEISPANGQGWISRYAWGDDYHDVMRRDLDILLRRIRERCDPPIEARICIDTAPILERTYARLAGLGWIGKNTCLINERSGSWFFLGEILLSLDLTPDTPPPERCGTCTRCIDACPTDAIVPDGDGWTLDSRLCISYLTIEKRGALEPNLAAKTGNNVFGCDICQDVCPWNRRSPVSADSSFAPREFAPPLEQLAGLSEPEFRSAFRNSPILRAKYSGFLRNIAAAIGNSGQARLQPVVQKLAAHPDSVVAATARDALSRLTSAQAAGRGSQQKRNSADLAAAGESVVRELLRRPEDGSPIL